jgi:hypothetical protein
MTDPEFPAPPAWVYKRDGRLVPFEADKISRALFAAGESLGRPDAFLARELADGVVHFLAAESGSASPTTSQVEELVVKVVRELGQPALAEAFAAFARQRDRGAAPVEGAARPDSPPRPGPGAPAGEVVLRFAVGTPLSVVLPACVRSYTLQTVFTRDLVAAQGDGLLTLTGLEAPGELAGCVLGPKAQVGGGLVTALEEVRRFAGRFVALDGPEYQLAGSGRLDDEGARALARELAVGLRITGLEAVVNLNCALPPSWVGDPADGPLFAGQRHAPRAEDLAAVADALARELLPEAANGRVRIDWHLGERDFVPGTGERLLGVVRPALDGQPVAFVFDRPRRPVALAEGVDRQHPAVLLTVGLHLPRLAEQAGMDGDPARFLQRLGSLARLALSAAVQKREYLRRQERARPGNPSAAPAVTSGFLLDRARLVVAPVGLDGVAYSFLQRGLCAGGAALDFGRQVVARLRDVLRQDGRASHLETCLDGPFSFRLGDAPGEAPAGGRWPVAKHAPGLTPWDGTAPVRNQLRAAGVLHAAAEGGTLALVLPEDRPPMAELVADWLRTAWQQTEVARARLVRAVPAHRQLTFGG